MALIIPLLSLLLGSIFLYRKTLDLRLSLILSAISHGLFVLLASELLGLIECFSPCAIVVVWLVPPIALVLAQWGCLSRNTSTFFSDARTSILALGKLDVATLAGLTALSLITLVVSLAGTPNNHDSMTYHLPRIIMWFQQASLAHFPADDFRMLYNPPLAELLQAHAWALSGGYAPAMNIIQWLAYLLLAVEASMLAKLTGGHRNIQIVAAICAATLPSSVLQAPTTQNDLVMGAFLFAGLVCLLNITKDKFGLNWVYGVLALSLALATKATALFFIPFLLMVSAWLVIRQKKYIALLLLPLIIIPSAGWLSRNQAFFGNALGYHDQPSMEHKINFYKNERLSPCTCLSSTAKNLSLFLATPLAGLNSKVESAVRKTSQIMKVDADDPGLTWYYQKYHVPVTGPHEDAPPVFWHFLLACALCSLTFLRAIRQRTFSIATGLSLSIIAGMLATASYVKWMPWNIRFLALWLIPLLAVNINHTWVKNRSMLYALCSMLLFASLPFACFSVRRSLATFDITIGSQPLQFVSVFEKDTAFKFTLDKQKARELNELTGFVEGQAPSAIAIVRHGVDPGIFQAMYLLKESLPSVTYSFCSYSILTGDFSQHEQVGRATPASRPIYLSPIILTLNSAPPFDNSLYAQAFANPYGAVFIPSTISQK